MAWWAPVISAIPMAIDAITKLINGKDGNDKSEPAPQRDTAAEEGNNALRAQNEALTEQIERIREEQRQKNDELAAHNKKLHEDIARYQKEHEEQLKQMTKLLAELKDKKLDSFEAIEKHDKKAKEALIELAKQAKPIKMEGNHAALFGLTSTGKSTMLNKLLGEDKAATGFGETTLEVSSYPCGNFILWDVPGKNDEVSYMSLKYISFFKGLTRRLVLVGHTIKENSSMMKLLDAIGLTYDIVVNKMDLIDQEERPKFCEQIRKEINTIGLKGVDNVFFVSAKFPQQFPDWVKMVDYLSNSSK